MKAHDKVKMMLDENVITKFNLAKMMGMSRVTLDKRLATGVWKPTEIAFINGLSVPAVTKPGY